MDRAPVSSNGYGQNRKMESKVHSQKGWSLPILWILLSVGIVVFLSYRYNWWWFGALVAFYLGIAIVSILIRGKTNAGKGELDPRQ